MSEDRGISPVIGVVLLVAVTVVIAGIVGLAVTDLSRSTSNGAPSHGFSFDTQADGDVVITSTGGEKIDSSRVTVLVDGSPAIINESFSGTINAGSQAEAKDVASGSVVTVRWSDDEESTTLATWEVP